MTLKPLAVLALAAACVSVGAAQVPPTEAPAATSPAATSRPVAPRVEVARVGQVPVYLDEFGDMLHSRITQPLLEEFARENMAEISATPAELQGFARANPFANAPVEQRPPAEQLAEIAKQVIERHKFQVALYRKYGGGRVLFQQSGLEAWDATRRFLEESEKAGKFSIADPNLRLRFYGYWNQDPGPALSKDSPEDPMIKQFLSPPWNAPAQAATTSPSTQPAVPAPQP